MKNTKSAHSSPSLTRRGRAFRQTGLALIVATATLLSGAVNAAVDIAQAPLYAGSRVPGNLVLVPSVEYPTIISQANLGEYEPARRYTGYFDSGKCYEYIYSDSEPERHFSPVGAASAEFACTANQKHWSGNYLNWAATQTIDPFRSALTGGYRVRDTATETWLEKARHDRNELYPERSVGTAAVNVTPIPATNGWSAIKTRIAGLGNRMYFTLNGDLGAEVATAYNPSVRDHALISQAICASGSGKNCPQLEPDSHVVYEVSIRVKVCVEGMLEANCKQYSQASKPEGLIQEYSDRLRYSIFGYLNDSSATRDGGVLRANQKYVGPQTHDPLTGPLMNPAAEWDSDTGVLLRHPDQNAGNTLEFSNIFDSGVINYLNKFGQITGAPHKSHDPVSELFYAATRYFKNLGNIPEYSSLSGDDFSKNVLADGFPVITSWNDPIQYRCQVNTTLGIGDIYSHRDRNLPGADGQTGEPALPDLVKADDTVDVKDALSKIAQMEGRDSLTSSPFTGRHNSAYIAALAYDAHTRDMRPDDEGNPNTRGMQTMSTHWVDVRENQRLEPWYRNQYWLAAKYGGFRVPPGFDPYSDQTTGLLDGWWNSSGETLTSNYQGDITFKRPDNFYVASEANKMVESLTLAFRNIAAETIGSGSSLAANSTRLETGSMAYQARYYSGSWRGELSAYPLDAETGLFSASPAWNAGDELPAWAARNIYVHNPEGKNAGQRFARLTWDALGPRQQSALEDSGVVDFLRGDRSREGSEFRVRQGLIGDIVHSQPIYVGQPQMALFAGMEFAGSDSYVAYVEAQINRKGMVYIGANDGMLHGFDDEGVERFAFMPDTAISERLREYASPNYEHQYFVDGELTVADVYIGGSWKTVLVGTMGRGGKGVYALDVTDPDDIKFLWEVNSTDVPALGNTLGKPIIAQVAEGQWKVLLGNGPNSTAGTAQLITLDVASGNETVISTGVGSDNGLSAVDAWDTNRDGFYETIYAGDLKGNLWKFSSGEASVLFAAKDPTGAAQPITAAPFILMNPTTREVWVYFGTGKYLGTADQSVKQVQTWYALIDSGEAIIGRPALSASDVLAEVEGANGLDLRVTSEQSAADLLGKKGWYLDLVSPSDQAQGERMVVPSRLERGLLIGTTRIPDVSDICSPGGRGFVMSLDPFTGSRPASSFFDTNGDGVFDDSDMVEVDGKKVPVSGVGFSNAPNAPIFLDEVMLINLEDGSKKNIKTRGVGGKISRESWREIIGG